jgi:hypothetical protein
LSLYKTKKILGKNKKKELEELVEKRIGEFSNFEKMDLGIIIHNLQTNIKDLKEELSI